MRRVLLGCLLLLAAVFACACEGKAVTGTIVETELTGDGGTLLGPSGSRVIVPAQNNLIYPVWVALGQLDKSEVPDFPGYERLSVGFFMMPSRDDVSFAPAARVELRYAEGDLSESDQHSQLIMCRYVSAEDGGSWQPLPNGVADSLIHVFQAETEEFGLFGVFIPETSAADTDSDSDAAESETETDAAR